MTSPRPDTVEEAGWFADKLNESELAVEGLVVNRVHPAFGAHGTAARRSRPAAPWPGSSTTCAATRPSTEREERACRRAGGPGGPVPGVPVPLLDVDVHDVDGLGLVADLLSSVADRRRPDGRGTPSGSANLTRVRTILVASDAPSVRAEVAAVVGQPGIEIVEVRLRSCRARRRGTSYEPDLVVVDLQMGNMGGMAVCLELRLEESYGNLPHVPVLMLLDRRPDVFLAKRSGAEGWIVKPLDPIRLRRAHDGPARRGHVPRRVVPARPPPRGRVG